MRTFLLISILFGCLQLFYLRTAGQDLRPYSIPLRTKTIAPGAELNATTISRINQSLSEGSVPALLQFENIPDAKQKKALLLNGIHLLNYLGGNAYVVSVDQTLKVDVLKSLSARSILSININDKISSSLEKVTTDTTVHASIFSFISVDDAITKLNEKGFKAKKAYGNYPVLEIDIPAGRVIELAALPFIEYMEPPAPPRVELNYRSTAGTRANVLHTPNYNLNGEGIVFQVNEVTGYPQDHIDFVDRSIENRVNPTGAYHSTHVHGIIGGAGLINELYKGYAPKSRMFTYVTIDGTQDGLNYGVDITNNSYADGRLCSGNPSSNYLSSMTVDMQALQHKSLIHVMAAGNSGTYQCPLFPTGYNTVYTGYQSAKSTLSVGATFSNGVLADLSSRGPGRSGRFKPEIVAPGADIISTTPYNYYGTDYGTSMACPAVVGGLGLLYQRYQQLHGTKPDNALMKPLLCNSATDLGPVGPDYGYGFGFMNLNRAIQVLDAGNFYKDSVANQKIKTRTITVPQGIAKLKVMLYWQDPVASALTSKPLINDLDIRITSPTGTTVLPYTLDTLPSLVTNLAKRGVDHVNNIEQVVIDNPAAGIYSVNVEGYENGEGDQQSFYVVYDLVPDAVQLTFPANEEVVAPNDNIIVQWDSWGDTSSKYTLEFSADNGNNWQTISSTITSNSFNWTVPSVSSNTARFRVTRNNDGKTSSPGSFRIIGVPSIKLSASQCPGSIAMDWTKVNGATDYEIMMYRNGDMSRIAITADTSYVIRNLSEDSVYYVTVRTRSNGLPGRRAYALSVQPNNGDCSNSVHDNDLKAHALIYPVVGRAFTSKQLGTEAITMRIKNLDNDIAASGFTVAYSINGKPWIKDTVTTAIPANSSFDYTFRIPFDFSAGGNYTVRLAVTHPADTNHGNDTTTALVRHLLNVPVDVLTGTADHSPDITVKKYLSNYTGIENIERFDYENSSNNLFLQVGYGIWMYSSNQADANKSQSLTATYNLSLADTSKQSVELRFNYYHYSAPAGAYDSLLIRGSDTSSWILVQNLLPVDSPRTVNKTFAIQLTDILKAQGQNFSPSLQVRWSIKSFDYGVSIDDVKLLNKTNDVALISIDSLLPYSCGLSNNTPVQIKVQNNNNIAVNNLPVKYRVNKGNIVSEIIPSIPAKTTISYKFKQTADLSPGNNYTIETWVANPQDAFSANDSISLALRSQPLITAFPYVEDFEKNNGGWYTAGTNSSWEWGTPSSPLISGAASGKGAWKTNIDGNYNAAEFSQVYSGCYDFSKLTKPVISTSIALNMDSCLPYCDAVNLQYCTNGKDWKAMPLRSIYKWQQQFTSLFYNRWHVATERSVDSLMIIQFRFAFRSDAIRNFEGVGIDDFHVYDSTNTIYEGNSTRIQQAVNSTQQWTTFKQNNGLIAAINTQGQSLDDVQIQTFLSNDAVRNFHGQYYLNRNFVFKPGSTLKDSIVVRLYFTDKESDSLLFEKSCSNCTLPKNAYRFGISFYKSSDSTELDSSILNNRKGEWNFIANDKVKIVPFMNGYYAEFKVKDGGEFRLSNGGLDGKSDLPVQVQNLSAERLLSNADLKWNTVQEINIDHFDVEVAEGNDAFKNELFKKLGEVKSKGRSTTPQQYNFTDDALNKKGVRYYRLKNIDAFGNYTYTNAVPVVFNEELQWQVYPNPSNGKYKLLFQSAPGDNIQMNIFSSTGQLLKEMHFTSNGFVQSQEIDLSKTVFANGVYVLKIRTQEKMHVLRLIKQ